MPATPVLVPNIGARRGHSLTKHGYPRHRQTVDPSLPSRPWKRIHGATGRATTRALRTSVQMRDAGELAPNEFVFYDGPPFASSLPHYGHLPDGRRTWWARFWTMKGHRVERRFGWDTHGLPAERGAAPARYRGRHRDHPREGWRRYQKSTRPPFLRPLRRNGKVRH